LAYEESVFKMKYYLLYSFMVQYTHLHEHQLSHDNLSTLTIYTPQPYQLSLWVHILDQMGLDLVVDPKMIVML